MTSALIATVSSSVPISPSFTAWPSATGPWWMRSGLLSLAAMSRAFRPRRRDTMSPMIDASVSTPIPPICTPSAMKAWPSGVQYVAMSTVARPVTQIAETAVKSASAKGAVSPVEVMPGSMRIVVSVRTSAAKMRIAKRAGVECAK